MSAICHKDKQSALVTLEKAAQSLSDSVEKMRCAYRLGPSTDEMVAAIKATMQVRIEPYGFTVVQTLYNSHRANSFNSYPVPKAFELAIQDFVTLREGRTSARKTRQRAANAWKQNLAVHRRICANKMLSTNEWRSLYRGQPERYDPEVVHAFGNSIMRVTGQNKIRRGTCDRGPMVAVLVAAVTWAMTLTWLFAGTGWEPPRPASRLGMLKIMRGR